MFAPCATSVWLHLLKDTIDLFRSGATLWLNGDIYQATHHVHYTNDQLRSTPFRHFNMSLPAVAATKLHECTTHGSITTVNDLSSTSAYLCQAQLVSYGLVGPDMPIARWTTRTILTAVVVQMSTASVSNLNRQAATTRVSVYVTQRKVRKPLATLHDGSRYPEFLCRHGCRKDSIVLARVSPID